MLYFNRNASKNPENRNHPSGFGPDLNDPTLPCRDHLRIHLDKIARPRDLFENPEALSEIQNYIEEEFKSYGYAVRRQAFPFREHTFFNLIAQKNPDASRPRFVIGSHFDAVPGTPGADDNASGVAAMLEAARLVKDSAANAVINWVAFNAEEYGMVGSTFYARELKKAGCPIAGMISLEMVGFTNSKKGSQRLPVFLKPFYPDTGNFLALVGDDHSKELLKNAKKYFSAVRGLPVESLTVPGKGWVIPETRLSDHSPFWDEGYPALLVTDTSFFRNPHYHSVHDTIETIDLEFLARVTEGIARFVDSH